MDAEKNLNVRFGFDVRTMKIYLVQGDDKAAVNEQALYIKHAFSHTGLIFQKIDNPSGTDCIALFYPANKPPRCLDFQILRRIFLKDASTLDFNIAENPSNQSLLERPLAAPKMAIFIVKDKTPSLAKAVSLPNYLRNYCIRHRLWGLALKPR